MGETEYLAPTMWRWAVLAPRCFGARLFWR